MTPSVNNVAGIRTVSQDSVEPKKPTGVSTLSQTDFLKLLTAQLKNQDPTEPVDNAQFVSQMAQFSTVSGIEQLNKGLGDVAARLSAGEIAGAAALIGRTATYETGIGGVASGRITGIETTADGTRLGIEGGTSILLGSLRGISG